ncbi:unnamed protein product [Brassicogethes aeneus]|uniref:CYTH domain-containing protein n=1 Tax=Brassicogethes aeneus TaxID=1431903 RepID=A0A9P0FM79_BRAAE|nr:unnamed protein product [Brassicogethes aeneus]
MRNVEIKARVKNIADLVSKAAELSGTKAEIIKQHDTFYNVNNGRLKFRKFEDGHGELIYYERPDAEGPKMCSYDKSSVPESSVSSLTTVLERALGKKSIVKKVRQLFLVDKTRIHIDSVEDLGDFMELEVVLSPEQTPEEGEKIAHVLMGKLGIDKSDLISGAYTDLLNK